MDFYGNVKPSNNHNVPLFVAQNIFFKSPRYLKCESEFIKSMKKLKVMNEIFTSLTILQDE